MDMALDDFHQIRDHLHAKTGIYLSDDKMYFLQSRVEARCRETTCDNAREYHRFLKFDKDNGELKQLIELVTVNETYFFRDFPQLKAYALEVLPLVMEHKRATGDRMLRIWSAGCSTGEEPYTLAMMANEVVKDMRIQVVASDINDRVLGVARRAAYSGRSLKDVPSTYLSKYFVKRDTSYEVNPSIKQMVEFWPLNLIDKNRMRIMSNFDVIFCRNVVIYFSNPVVKQIISCFYDSLRKGGFIFLGSSESMHMFSGAYKLVKFKDVFAYMKE